jgi:hypothetical protein
MRTEVSLMTVADTDVRLAALREVEADLREAGGVKVLELSTADTAAYTVILVEPEVSAPAV